MDMKKQLKMAADETARVTSSLNVWAKSEGAKVLKQIELQRRPETLSLHWPRIKQGWLGGFISGVTTGFQLGYKTANNLGEALGESSAALLGTEKEVIAAKNMELRKYLGEMIGEASMLWSELPKGEFQSTKAVELVDKLMSRFQTPMPESPAEMQEAAGQERLPGL